MIKSNMKLFGKRGIDYKHHITTYPPDFPTFLRPWLDLSLDLKAIFCSTSVSFCESTFLLLVLQIVMRKSVV